MGLDNFFAPQAVEFIFDMEVFLQVIVDLSEHKPLEVLLTPFFDFGLAQSLPVFFLTPDLSKELDHN